MTKKHSIHQLLSGILLCGSGCPGWNDIPPAADMASVPRPLQDAEITALINDYNAIPKSHIETLGKRVGVLAILEAALRNRMDMPRELTPIPDLIEAVTAKRTYLDKLSKLYSEEILIPGPAIYNHDLVRPYFESFQGFEYAPIILNNTLHYDACSSRFCGEYWLEVLDPCHRPLEHYKKKWLERTDRSVPFFLWLEDEPVSPYHRSIDLFTPAVLQECRVDVANGALVTRGDARPLATQKTEMLFVINQGNELLASPMKEKVRHISLSWGKAVIGVGALKTNSDGMIVELRADSGHYIPGTKLAGQMIPALRDQGVSLDDRIPFYCHELYRPIQTTIGQFAKGDF